MIVVKLELWPFGDASKAKELGRTYIANVGGNQCRGNYSVGVCRKGTTAVPRPVLPQGPEPTRQGRVEKYPRLAHNVWRLVIRALRSAFPEEDLRPAGSEGKGEGVVFIDEDCPINTCEDINAEEHW